MQRRVFIGFTIGLLTGTIAGVQSTRAQATPKRLDIREPLPVEYPMSGIAFDLDPEYVIGVPKSHPLTLSFKTDPFSPNKVYIELTGEKTIWKEVCYQSNPQSWPVYMVRGGYLRIPSDDSIAYDVPRECRIPRQDPSTTRITSGSCDLVSAGMRMLKRHWENKGYYVP